MGKLFWPRYVKCVIEVDSSYITVITMPGFDEDAGMLGRYIVILRHFDQRIGISADEVYMITVSASMIMKDTITGTKAFVYEGKTYSILDEDELYRLLVI